MVVEPHLIGNRQRISAQDADRVDEFRIVALHGFQGLLGRNSLDLFDPLESPQTVFQDFLLALIEIIL